MVLNSRRFSLTLLLTLVAVSVLPAEADLDEWGQLPQIGPWLLTKDGRPADWLGVKWKQKSLREPINLILIDPFSKTPEESVRAVEEDCRLAGYRKEFGHSSGYLAEIGGQFQQAIPREWRTAFSNKPMWETNNHGRLFGPVPTDRGYLYAGSFSRESFDLWGSIHHRYLSFSEARTDFVNALEHGGRYRLAGELLLGNVEPEASDSTTGDHDGYLVIVQKIAPP